MTPYFMDDEAIKMSILPMFHQPFLDDLKNIVLLVCKYSLTHKTKNAIKCDIFSMPNNYFYYRLIHKYKFKAL